MDAVIGGDVESCAQIVYVYPWESTFPQHAGQKPLPYVGDGRHVEMFFKC